jgi:hypothetical protein
MTTDRSPFDSPPPGQGSTRSSSSSPSDREAPCTAVFVDAIEDGVARLLDAHQEHQEGSWSLPVAWLPANVREGEWLSLTARRSSPPHPPGDPEGTTAEARRASLSADDPGGPIKL